MKPLDKDVIGIGVISWAHGHSGAYCDQMQGFKDVRLVAAWDDNETRGREAAARFDMEYTAALDDLLGRNDIDAVIVTCETNRHADVIEAACRAGKHILCQKPMATTLADCDRIIAAVDKTGVHFQMAFQMRCDPMNRKIKQWLDEGAVGRVGALRRRHCINFLFNPDLPKSASAWHIDPVKNVGMFFDDAVHATDFFYWLMGKPVSVMAEIDNVLTDVAPDDTGIAIYRWPNKAMGVLFNASVTLAGENSCEIYGDEGVIIQNYGDAVSTGHAPPGVAPLRLFRKSTGKWEAFDYQVPASQYNRLQAVPRPWLDDLKSGAEPSVSARDGRISVEMCIAAYQSAREGRRIELQGKY